jgi:hypothetical protein
MPSPLALRLSLYSGSRHQIATFRAITEREQIKMTNEEILGITVLNSWKLVINRFGKTLSELSDEQLQQQVAPGRNRVFYLLGQLTAVHDRMFPLLGLGDRLHPELDDAYITNSDRVLVDPLSAIELRRAWNEVNDKLTAAFERFTLEDWLQKHAAVSEEDFINDPTRNRLAVVMNRTNHASYHSGQATLAL